MKFISEKLFFKFLIIFFVLTSFTILTYIFINHHIVNIDEFKYVDWSLNIFTNEAVLIYYRPFFYIIGNTLLNIFGVDVFTLKSINLIFFLANIILIIKISKKYFINNQLYIIPLIFFLFNPYLLYKYSIIGPFPISHFFILINIYLILLIIENDKKELLILLGVLNSLGSLCREELIFIFFINSFFIFFFIKKRKTIIYYIVSFLAIHSLFFIYFFDKIDFSRFISVGLNVVDKEINFSIRKYYYNSEIDITYHKIFDFFGKFKSQFSQFFLLNQVLILSIFYQFYLNFKKKIRNDIKINYLLFLIIFFLIFYFFIRARDELFIFYEPLFVVLFLSQLSNLKFKRKNYHNFILILILILSFSKIYIYYKDGKFKPKLSVHNLLYEKILEDYTNQKIFISPSSKDLIHLPSKYYNNKPSENFSLTSKLYFGDQALLFNDLIHLIQKKDNKIDDIIDLNINYLVVQVNSSEKELIFKNDEINTISKILKLDLAQIQKLNDNKITDNNSISLYGGNLKDYFKKNEYKFNELLINNFEIKKILKLQDKVFIDVDKLDAKGYYLIYLKK